MGIPIRWFGGRGRARNREIGASREWLVVPTWSESSKGHPVPGMRVDAQRRFSAHYQPSSHETIDVTGKFSKSFHRASGTLRDQGDFPPQATGCDTGVDKWAASKLNVTGG